MITASIISSCGRIGTSSTNIEDSFHHPANSLKENTLFLPFLSKSIHYPNVQFYFVGLICNLILILFLFKV